MLLPSKHSFRPVLRSKWYAVASVGPVRSEKTIDTESAEVDTSKRSFLKLMGLVGLGVAVSSALPNKAEAFVLGKSASSGGGTTGVKNVAGTQINPATEDTLALVKAQTDKFAFDGSSNLYVQSASSFSTQVENASSVVINPATEDTLALIKAQTNKLTFDGSNNLLTSVGGSGNVVGLKDTTSTQINPATDDSLVYLRRIVKLMESQATVDTQNRQRVAVDSWGSVTTGNGVGVAGAAGTLRVSVASDSGFSTNITTLNGWGDQMFQDVARNTYATGIRLNLSLT